MTTKVADSSYRCDICGTRYTGEPESQLCERRGIRLPRFLSGDVIHLQVDEVGRLGLPSSDVLVEMREFLIPDCLTHDYAFADRGVRYHVKARGGRPLEVYASALVLWRGDHLFYADWSDFFRRVSAVKSIDREGLDVFRSELNRRLGLGL